MSTPTSPTFKIIGGDGNEYGPVDLATLQQWAREGRLARESRVWDSRTGGWQSALQVAELAGVFGAPAAAAAPLPLPPAAVVTSMELANQVCQRGYRVAIGDWFSQGWEFFKARMGFALGACWIVFGLSFFISLVGMIPCLGPVVQLSFNLVVQPPLVAGLWWVLLQRRRGAVADAGQVFDGFKLCFGQSVLANLIMGLLILAACIPGGAVLLAGGIIADSRQMVGIPLVVLGVALVLIAACYLGVSYMFAMPLVADRRMQFWTALETSRRVISRHWFGMFALTLLLSLINIAGFLACCVGFVFTLPLTFCILAVAYDGVFGATSAPSTT